MPDLIKEVQDETWEVNVAKTRRRRDPKKGGARNASKKSSGPSSTSTTSFGGWAKPTTPKSTHQQVQESSITPEKATENVPVPTDNAAQSVNAEGDFQMQPLSALLADYGEFDPHWMNQQPEIVETESPTSTLKVETQRSTTNRLGQQGKAPLHIDIISFGFRYGAPSTRKDGWSQTQPLQPFDCRDILPPVPGYMQFHDGLSSGQVKRFLLYDFRRQNHRRKAEESSEQDGNGEIDEAPSVRDYSVDTVAPKIYEALIEAVRTGGYGYALPLRMQIFVGSEWGRHRSVVAAEQTASALRNLLRNCKEYNVLECPCSVATQHRDIERKMPSKKTKDDDDD